MYASTTIYKCRQLFLINKGSLDEISRKDYRKFGNKGKEFISNDVELMRRSFKDVIANTFKEECVELGVSNRKNLTTWWNVELKKDIRMRNRKYLVTKTMEVVSNLKEGGERSA